MDRVTDALVGCVLHFPGQILQCLLRGFATQDQAGIFDQRGKAAVVQGNQLLPCQSDPVTQCFDAFSTAGGPFSGQENLIGVAVEWGQIKAECHLDALPYPAGIAFAVGAVMTVDKTQLYKPSQMTPQGAFGHLVQTLGQGAACGEYNRPALLGRNLPVRQKGQQGFQHSQCTMRDVEIR